MNPGLEPLRRRMDAELPVKWLFTGDSVTHGALHTWGHRDYTELFSERIRWELGRYRDLILNTGVSGRTIADLAADLDWSVFQFRPDVVLLMFGINDSRGGTDGVDEFRRQLGNVIERIRDFNAATTILLQTPNPVLPEAFPLRAALPSYAEAVRRTATAMQVPLIDHWDYWQRAAEADSLRRIAWMNDELHPNAYGHLAIAAHLLRELELWDAQSQSGRLFLP